MWLVSCGADIKLHNCQTYEVEQIYKTTDTSGLIRNISWCKDGSWLALVPYRGNAEIIRTKDDVRLLQSILGVPHPTVAVFQKTTKKHLAMSNINGDVLVYDIKNKSIKKQFSTTGHTASIIAMDWSFKDAHLAAGNTDGEVIIFSNTTNQQSSSFRIPASKSVSVVRFHTTLRALLGATSDEGIVSIWDINVNKQKLNWKIHKAPVTDLVFSSQNKNLMLSVGLDRTYQCYDINAGSVALSVLTDQPLSSVDLAPDGYTVVVGSSRGSLYVYDLRENSKPLFSIAAQPGEIRKVLYQPLMDIAESFNITEESLPSKSQISKPKISVSIDSFSLNTVQEFSPQGDSRKSQGVSAEGDSFFNFLDNFDQRLNTNFPQEKSEMSNLGISDGVKKWLDSKHSQLDSTQNQESVYVQEKLSEVYPGLPGKANSSTPLTNTNQTSAIIQEMNASNLSPIVTASALQGITKKELNAIIKNAVSETVSEQISDMMDSLSSHFLNLQMSFSKQFVNQEIEIERLAEYLQNSSGNLLVNKQIQQLQQENEFLRNKINDLLKK